MVVRNLGSKSGWLSLKNKVLANGGLGKVGRVVKLPQTLERCLRARGMETGKEREDWKEA